MRPNLSVLIVVLAAIAAIGAGPIETPVVADAVPAVDLTVPPTFDISVPEQEPVCGPGGCPVPEQSAGVSVAQPSSGKAYQSCRRKPVRSFLGRLRARFRSRFCR